MYKSKNKLRVTALITMILSSAAASAHHGRFGFCNESSGDLKLSVLYRSGIGLLVDKWKISGWHDVQKGKCLVLFDESSDALQMHVGFKRPASQGGKIFHNVSVRSSGKFAYSGQKTKFCVDLTDDFSRPGTVASHETCTGGTASMLHPVYLNVKSIPMDQNYDNVVYIE